MSTMTRHILIDSGTLMKASIVDLRYKTKEILNALERNERVTILYHGKVRGVITPVSEKPVRKVKEHPFFGMASDSDKTVLEELKDLRNARHDF